MSFNRKPPARVRVYPTPIPEHLRRNATMSPMAAAQHEAIAKAAPVRSEAYRRAVASLPCKVCGIEGHSQAAHPNNGKGAGMKTDDRLCFPLCADRPGVQGCHSKFDQGAMFDRDSRRMLEVDWGVDTRCAITNMGLWPKNLAKYVHSS